MLIRKIVRNATPRWIRRAARLAQSEIVQTGWVRSERAQEAVDANGSPLPWLPYPAIRFLDERTPPSAEVFEYGMGSSTLWWAQRVRSVIACEHDPVWFEKIKARLPQNASGVLHSVESENYVEAARASGRLFDVVVIDGRRRVQCAKRSLSALSPGGVIVWDNADREYYSAGFASLKAAGFRRLDLWGFGPLSFRNYCTAIFYRDGNCFGL